MNINTKLPAVGTNIFTIMSKLAADHDSINLGQGFPDFNTDPALLSLVSQAMAAGHNQYPFMTGVPALRQTIAEKMFRTSGHQYDIDQEVTVTSGATEALMAGIISCVGPGDEVIILEPCYDSYIPAITLAGATPVSVPLSPPTSSSTNFSIDWTRVAAHITSSTKLLILNFPHNPTGAVLTDTDLDELERLGEKHDLLFMSDEVYEHIVFTEGGHKSLASRPALVARTFLISSFGKTTHTTGWKLGYCCAPPKLTTELRKVHQFMVFTVPSPFQHAMAQYCKNPETYQNLSAFYQQKRDYLANGLKQTRFKPLPCYGTFFLLADYSDISDLPEADFSVWLTKNHGVTVIPVSAFYSEPLASTSNHAIVRFCFAKQPATLNAAIDRLMKV